MVAHFEFASARTEFRLQSAHLRSSLGFSSEMCAKAPTSSAQPGLGPQVSPSVSSSELRLAGCCTLTDDEFSLESEMEDTSSARLCLRVLGSFEVMLDGVAIPEDAWPRRKTKSLLKVLLTAPGDPFTVDQLIEAVLPEADVSRAASNIRARVSELRKVLEPSLRRGSDSQYVKRIGEGYAFNPNSDSWLDSLQFEQQIAEGHQHADGSQWTRAVDSLKSASALYRGEFLVEDRYADWAKNTRSRLREQHLQGLSRLAACYAELGRHRQVASCCRKILAVDACHESAAQQLLKVQSDTGHRAQMTRTYQQLEQALQGQLGVEPSVETQELFRELSQRESTRAERFDPRRLVVIPLVSVAPDPANEFLADGITEELIYTLSKVAGLEVIAQTTALKYKGARKSVAEIGRELRVGSLLEGSVQQVQGKTRILVQLIKVEGEAHLWAEQYDRDAQDILGVQGDVARKVATALEVQLLAKEEAAIRKEEESNREAHTAYMRGRLFLARRTREAYLKAIDFFERSIATVPDYARAFTGLADAYLLLVEFASAPDCYDKARVCTQQALELDPLCAEAYASLGRIAWLDEGDVHKAESKFLRAIELNPNYAQAHDWYAGLLIHTGRFKDACQQSETALSLDPLSAPVVLRYARSLHEAGRLVEAVDQYQQALEIDSELESAWWGLWYCLAAMWDWDRAEAITRKTLKQHPDNPCAHVNLAQCVTCRGRIEEGQVEIRKALALAGNPPRAFILYHAGINCYFARQYDEGIEFFRQLLKRNPAWNSAHNLIAKCLIQQECLEEALDELDAAERVFGGADPFWDAHTHMDRGIIHARLGEPEKAENELAVLMHSSGRLNRRFAVAGILDELGKADEAMDWLEAAATAREPHVTTLLKVPAFDRLRSHSRFQALLKRIGLAG